MAARRGGTAPVRACERIDKPGRGKAPYPTFAAESPTPREVRPYGERREIRRFAVRLPKIGHGYSPGHQAGQKRVANSGQYIGLEVVAVDAFSQIAGYFLIRRTHGVRWKQHQMVAEVLERHVGVSAAADVFRKINAFQGVPDVFERPGLPLSDCKRIIRYPAGRRRSMKRSARPYLSKYNASRIYGRFFCSANRSVCAKRLIGPSS